MPIINLDATKQARIDAARKRVADLLPVVADAEHQIRLGRACAEAVTHVLAAHRELGLSRLAAIALLQGLIDGLEDAGLDPSL